jgi:hypothetical protein
MRIIKAEHGRADLNGARVVFNRFATDAQECFDLFSSEVPMACVTVQESGEEVLVYFDEVDLLARLPMVPTVALIGQLVAERAKAHCPNGWQALVEADVARAGDCGELGVWWACAALLRRSIRRGLLGFEELVAVGLSPRTAREFVDSMRAERQASELH